MDESKQFEALNELNSIEDLSQIRHLVARTAVQRTVLELWHPCSSKAETIWQSEMVKNAYRRLVQIDFYNPSIDEIDPANEAQKRNDQYLQILDFRGCPLEPAALAPLQPDSFLSLPRDLFIESQQMRLSLTAIYGHESPLSDDLA